MSWPPWLWTESASVHLHLWTRKISASFAVWSCSPEKCRMREVQNELTPISKHVILLSCPSRVICIASSPSYASLTPSSVRCMRRSVCLQLSRSRLTRKWCWNGSRAFHRCLVLIICVLRRRLCGCLFAGYFCSWYHMGGYNQRI